MLRAKDNLHSDKFMGTEKGFIKNYTSQKYEGPTYENSHGSKINWGAEQYNTPRKFTVRNIKDLFYANMNRSKAQQRLDDSEENIKELWLKCKELTDTCATQNLLV